MPCWKKDWLLLLISARCEMRFCCGIGRVYWLPLESCWKRALARSIELAFFRPVGSLLKPVVRRESEPDGLHPISVSILEV